MHALEAPSSCRRYLLAQLPTFMLAEQATVGNRRKDLLH
jgi:hypothetical protein